MHPQHHPGRRTALQHSNPIALSNRGKGLPGENLPTRAHVFGTRHSFLRGTNTPQTGYLRRLRLRRNLRSTHPVSTDHRGAKSRDPGYVTVGSRPRRHSSSRSGSPRLAGKTASTRTSSSKFVAARSPSRRSSPPAEASTNAEWTDVERYDERPPAPASSSTVRRRFRSRSPSERRRRKSSPPASSTRKPRSPQRERGGHDSRSRR